MKKVLGYCNDWSRRAGDTVEFKVSTYGPDRFDATLVRVLCGDADPNREIFREQEIDAPFNGEHPGRLQPIHAGSPLKYKGTSPDIIGFSPFAFITPLAQPISSNCISGWYLSLP